MKLVVFLPAVLALVAVMAVLSSAYSTLPTGQWALSAGARASRPAQLRVQAPVTPVQLASLRTSGDHLVIFTYYDGVAMQTWAIRTVAYPDTTLKDFPADNPSNPGFVFIRWIHTDTSTDPVSYPEFTSTTPVVGDLEVRAYHQALPTLDYDSNGGGQAPASVWVLKAGETVRLAGQGDMAAPAGMVFDGWFVQEWTGKAYVQTGLHHAGDLYRLGSSTTLYAKWVSAP